MPGQNEVFVLLLCDSPGADGVEAPFLVHSAEGTHGLLVRPAPARRDAAVGLVGGAILALKKDSILLYLQRLLNQVWKLSCFLLS